MSAARVLVLDDEPEFGAFVRKVAEKMGCEVEVTDRAAAFQERLPVFKPTLIVLDVVMPEIDGIEAVQLKVEGEDVAWPKPNGDTTADALRTYDYPGFVQTAQPSYPAVPVAI